MGLTAPTHHIGAAPGAFAKTVLMPGDPLRAQYIAENYLDNVVKINEIRCMYAYTGTCLLYTSECGWAWWALPQTG